MEFATAAATVAQLALYAHGLIVKIKQAAETARQNKLECDDLAHRVSIIDDVLPRLQDPEVAQPLAGLGETLQDAHELVVECQRWSARRKFLYAAVHAERFNKVNRRIDSYLILIPLLSHIVITRRLDQIIPHDHTTVILPAATTMVAGADYQVSSPGSLSQQLESAMEFRSAEIAVLTRNFDHMLSEDCCGTVYKGRLHDGQEVVVKILKNQGRQGHEQEGAFVSELEILYQLHHDHIVRLVGWCGEDDERMFVYEHTRNGTLRDHLHGGKASPLTSSWKARVKALLGASRAIDHLHRVAAPRVIHRSVSSSSILLDESWTPRVSDFGAAVLQASPTGEEHGQVVAEVVGASGYIDPEYRRTKRVSSASDVYSFGVVMLEVLTGRPPKEGEDPMTTVGSAVQMIESGNLGSVLDRRPSREPTPREMEALELVAYTAARCLWQQDRPDMSNVVTNLDTALGLIEGVSADATLFELAMTRQDVSRNVPTVYKSSTN